ncbi:uncharacterized protein LOC110716653 [Chenopodium quinoa]|uniref:uncharacterized protein LOC110716653 n=1 Tax=Chenopodium quinoa TaxID=63459 RepID=UPI000B78C4C1|nr:uncharacterized protein LOC110716653 [Chenopodium quinoa]
MTVWIRFPELPVEYYDKEALFDITKLAGNPLRVDYVTDHLTRARYARVCIDIYISSPFITNVRVGNSWQCIEYENIQCLCFLCGKIGHSKDKCTLSQVVVDIASLDKELDSMLIPLKIHDVVQMERSEAWKEWDKFDVLFCNGKPVPPFLDLDMKIVLWNVRGASRNEFIPHALEVISSHKPSIFIILETKSDVTRASQVSNLLGFDKFEFVKPNGLRDGIWLMYKSNVELIDYIEGHTRNYFHALFKFSSDSKEVLLTAVHAPSSPSKRHRLWNDLHSSLPPDDTPWLFLGDLNEVTNPSEKSGGLKFRQTQCFNLNKLADIAYLVDLGFFGNPFTWHNAREVLDIIQERLDKAMGNPTWLNTYPNTQVSHLARTYSNHCPILISIFDNRKGGPYPFRCKAAWLEHPDFSDFFIIIGICMTLIS